MLAKSFLALAAASAAAAQSIKGFNYASNGNDQSAFEAQMTAAEGLPGTSGWNSARLYTMIQDGTTNTPIEAIPAAIATKSTLLLGLWASAGQAQFSNEIAALKSAIQQYGESLAKATVGISVGSEDLYRDTYTSQVVNKDSDPGAAPSTLISYIQQVRNTIKGTALADVPVGHVDTYTAYINSSNSDVISNLDFCGMDAYPYYQLTEANSIDDAYNLFYSAYDQTKSACSGKPVWVTETGWPYTGKTDGQAVASTANAEEYWQKVGCSLFGKTNVWWYTLSDAGANPAFGILGNSISNKPLYDLSCTETSSSSSGSATATKSGDSSKTSGSSDASATSGSGKGGDSSGSGSGSASATGSAGSGSASGAASPSGGSNSTGATTSGITSVTTPSTPRPTASTFPGAANRNAEFGASAAVAAVLGMLAYLL